MQKDPQASLDFAVDWSKWLQASESITVSTWTVPAGLTKDSDDHTTSVATVWLSGGTALLSYKVTNHITTNQGRQDERTLTIDVRDR